MSFGEYFQALCHPLLLHNALQNGAKFFIRSHFKSFQHVRCHQTHFSFQYGLVIKLPFKDFTIYTWSTIWHWGNPMLEKSWIANSETT